MNYDLSIRPLKDKSGKGKIKIKNPLMKQGIIPSFNEGSIVLVGSVKSGKSVLIQNLMTRKEFYGDFFDEDNKYLFSPTAKYDEIADSMDIPEENRISEDMIEELTDIVEEQTQEVKSKGKSKAKRLCLIFDDLSSCKKLQRSKVFEDIFTTNRHLNIMLFCCVHKISALTRLCRLQCAHICFFKASYSEMEILAREFCGSGLTKRQMIDLIKYATTPDDNSSHPFLYINLTAKPKQKYRKTFSQILELK